MAGRTFVARIGEREAPIEIESLGAGRYRLLLDGSEQILDARLLGGKLVSLLVDGRHHEVSLVRSGDDFDVLVANRRYRAQLVPEERARRRAARGAEARGRREIKASMPGKVVDVLVKVGDAVEAHQGLLIIEAMKMENEIRASGAGEVKEIHVKPGQAVETGEILAIVE